MNNPQLDQAREWAESIFDTVGNGFPVVRSAQDTAQFVKSLPDEWIDAEKVRELIDTYKHARDGNAAGTEGWVMNHLVVRNLESLITPPLPTLAELTPEEREACQWMQAMFTKSDHEHVITCIFANKSRLMRRDDGMGFEVPNDEIIPLPDLPKLEWPGSHADTITAESVEDVQAGRVADFEPGLPRPEDVPAGEPWLVKYDRYDWVGARKLEEGTRWPWALARLDGADYAMARDFDIALVSRLVPEDKP